MPDDLNIPLLTQRVGGYKMEDTNNYPDEPLPSAYIIEFYERYNMEMVTYACGSEIRVGGQKTASIMQFCRDILKIHPRWNSWDCITQTLKDNGYILHYSHKVAHLKSSRTYYVIAEIDATS